MARSARRRVALPAKCGVSGCRVVTAHNHAPEIGRDPPAIGTYVRNRRALAGHPSSRAYRSTRRRRRPALEDRVRTSLGPRFRRLPDRRLGTLDKKEKKYLRRVQLAEVGRLGQMHRLTERCPIQQRRGTRDASQRTFALIRSPFPDVRRFWRTSGIGLVELNGIRASTRAERIAPARRPTHGPRHELVE